MTLNDEQASVVESNTTRLLCLAGAGTGKTATMLARIDAIITKKHIPANALLVLTFTNAAAREMLNRYKRDHPNTIDAPKFCTFHAFCYQLIASDLVIRTKLGYSKMPMVCSEATLKRIYFEAEQATGISEKLITTAPENLSKLTEKRDREIIYKYVKRKLIEDNYITFDIMCNDVCKLFESKDDAVKPYHSQYKYIFVDEFQDTDRNQWRFVESFEDASIMVVGDTLQNLYSFRGTTNDIIKSLCKDDTWETHRLTKNYRSDSAIVKYANKFSTYANSRYRVEMEYNTDGGVVDDKSYHTYDEQNQYILDSLNLSGSTAILARTNKEVYHIQNMLAEHDVKFKNHHTTPNSTGIDLCKSVEDLDYAADWMASLLTKDYYNNYIRECLAIADVKDKIRLLHKYLNSSKLLTTVYHQFKHIYKLYSENDFDKIVKYLVYEIHTSNRILASNCESISDIISVLEINSDDSKSIYVGTIHSVKGLEFDNVIVTGVNTKTFSLNSEEQCNVFYVAITRAKHHLTVLRKD